MLAYYYATMYVIPAIDLLGNDAVRLERGDYDRVLFRQPIAEFMARIVATNPAFIHVVDLEGARDGALRVDVIDTLHRARGRNSPPGLGWSALGVECRTRVAGGSRRG